MTADSEPKKAKLDPSAFYSSPFLLPVPSMPQLLAGVPLTSVAASNAPPPNGATVPPPPANVCLAPITMPSCNNSQLQNSGSLSKVVHIRNLPLDMNDVELLQLCLQYARVSNYMMLKGKSQAFVEYESEAGAASFVNAMNSIPIQVRGRTIFAQYSTHQELKLDKNRPSQSSQADQEDFDKVQLFQFQIFEYLPPL
ncbi:hypothetical protein WR25_03094 [Diploscapter pachys]|uniref:RRM domain-containing protein n=1 Tax=Diploscapter pachys TaxID=2018661 RepID=A0A2A2L600_9BILA|nr:hypothetical protein WR25_03094 [Diploscapter pachys]